MLTLYHNDMSVCAQKVRIVLSELNAPWTSEHLNLRGDEQMRPSYLALNPKGQVPTLVHDGFVVVESTVINEYLAEAFPATALVSQDVRGRARMRWWTRQLDDDVHRSTAIMSLSIAFLHQYQATGAANVEHILQSIPEEARRDLKRKAFAAAMDNPDLPGAARRMDKLLGDMEAALSDGDWLAGDRISLADLNLVSYVLRMEHLQMRFMFDGRANLQAWFARCRARPAYRTAIVDWLNPSYLTLTAQTGASAHDRIEQMARGGP